MAVASPMMVRVVTGIVGLILLVAGARLYKPALMLAAFTAGGLLVVATLSTAGALVPALATPAMLAAGGLFAGVATAWVAHVAHRVALVVIGGLTGLSLASGIQHLVAEAPGWIPVVGAIVGAIGLPWVYESLLKVVTPAVGAVCIAWALAVPDTAWILGGLWAFGAAVQLAGPGKVEDHESQEEQ